MMRRLFGPRGAATTSGWMVVAGDGEVVATGVATDVATDVAACDVPAAADSALRDNHGCTVNECGRASRSQPGELRLHRSTRFK